MGTLAWHIVRRERNKALRNIAIAFPEWDEAKRRETVRAMLRHFGMSLFEIAWLWNMDLPTRDRTTTTSISATSPKLGTRSPSPSKSKRCSRSRSEPDTPSLPALEAARKFRRGGPTT